MVEQHWDRLRDETIRYQNHTWEPTGDVTVRNRGELVGVEARQTDTVRRRKATLYFGNATPPDSLNPGNFDGGVRRFERTDEGHHLLVETGARTYQYRLQRLEYY